MRSQAPAKELSGPRTLHPHPELTLAAGQEMAVGSTVVAEMEAMKAESAV